MREVLEGSPPTGDDRDLLLYTWLHTSLLPSGLSDPLTLTVEDLDKGTVKPLWKKIQRRKTTLELTFAEEAHVSSSHRDAAT